MATAAQKVAERSPKEAFIDRYKDVEKVWSGKASITTVAFWFGLTLSTDDSWTVISAIIEVVSGSDIMVCR